MTIDKISRLRIPYEYIVSHRLVYPTLAVGVTMVSGADWVYGAYATLVPATTITENFLVHSVTIESATDNGVMQMEIYHGASDHAIHVWRFTIAGGYWSTQPFLTAGTPLIPANDRIRGRLASSDGTANPCTMTVSIGYVIP